MMRIGQKLHPLLPKKARTGRPAADHRVVIDGILWIHRTGAPWNDLPARYGSLATISSRFYRWRSQGIWQEILNRLQQTPMLLTKSIGKYILLIAALSALTNTPPEPQGGTQSRTTIPQRHRFFSNKRPWDAQKGALVKHFLDE